MPVLRLLLVLMLVALASPPAHAQSEEEVQAQKLVETGLRDARSGRFADAVKKFEEAHKLFPHPDIVHNLARAHQKLKNFAIAYAYFQQALVMDPSYTYASQARSEMAKLERRLARTHGRVKVTSTPSQVNISLIAASGEPERHLVTPVERWVPAGVLKVEGAKTDFVDAAQEVTVVAGQDSAVEILLVPVQKKGFLDVTSNVPGAQVSVNGVDIGTTPIRALPYDIGTYAVRVEAPDHKPFETQVTVPRDEQATVFAGLEKIVIVEPETGLSDEMMGVILMSSGGLVLVVGAVLHGLAAGEASDPNIAESDGAFDDRVSAVRGMETGAWVSYGVAAGLLGAGAYFFVAAQDGGAADGDGSVEVSAEPTVIPYVSAGPDGAGVGAALRF